MKSTYSINPRRLLLLIRSSFFINRSLILILTAVFSALITLIAVKDTFTGEYTDLYQSMYYLLLLVSGLAVTWGIARELKDSRKGGTWLLLPASTMEKFLSLLLLSTLLLICAAAVYMTVLSFLVESGIGIFTSSYHKIFNPFGSGIDNRILIYISIQAPFLVGAIYFRKHPISFTFLSLFIYMVLLIIFASVTGKTLLKEHLAPLANFPATMDSTGKLYLMSLFEKFREFSVIWKPVVAIFMSYVFPPVCWITAFFSLKEMEQ
jgi:hypothetical protein